MERPADGVALAGAPAVRRQIIQWALGQRLPVASSSARVATDGGHAPTQTGRSTNAQKPDMPEPRKRAVNPS